MQAAVRSWGLFVAMEYVEGRSLASLLAARGKLPIPAVLALGKELGEALHAVHQSGVIHRDLKPSNVLIGAKGEEELVKVVDFGIAAFLASEENDNLKLTQPGEILGTFEYAAPEHLLEHAPADPRSDLYSLGVLLYECVTGQVPFSGPLAQVRGAHLQGLPVPSPKNARPELPEALHALIMRLLERDPAKRIPSAKQLVRIIQENWGRAIPPLALLEVRVDHESRRFLRAPYVAPLRVISPPQALDGRSADLSEGGILAIVSQSCEAGSRVEVRFPAPRSGKVVRTAGTVRWTRKHGQLWAIGIQFDELPEDFRAEIREYVKWFSRKEGDELKL
ncbi:MAG: serine/threonine-protein kinase [Sandaracinaceae bacterium]|nr:serine/threonine-protein kinase [Sandaracinaceae bacterium]